LFIPDPDPDFLTIPDPGPRGQQGTGSRIRNTVNIMKIVKVTANKSGTGGPSRWCFSQLEDEQLKLCAFRS
jgi:hypothetical protein